MTKNLTLEDIIKRKAEILKNNSDEQTKQLIVSSLSSGGTEYSITVKRPNIAIISEAASMGADGQKYLIYNCITEPDLAKAVAEYGCEGNPMDIVTKIFLPGEIKAISDELMSFAGYNDYAVSVVDDVKN